jgi:uncharacterized protein YeaO (DUF488 family)
MIKQGSLEELRSGVIKKSDGWLCLTTRYYPRFLKPGEIDEYVSDLAPSKKLLTEFKNKSARVGHDEAFEAVDYQLKFTLNEKGHAHLKMLTDLGKARDVYILCYCARGLYCHREMLLLLARDRYGAEIGPLTHAYPDFLKRIKDV